VKTYILDTNCILRYLLDDIKLQADKVGELFNKAKKEKLEVVLPQVVVFEVQFVLSSYYLQKRMNIADRIEILISLDFLKAESQDIFAKALKFYRENNISFVDSFLLSKCIIDKIDLFTFDKKLKNLFKKYKGRD